MGGDIARVIGLDTGIVAVEGVSTAFGPTVTLDVILGAGVISGVGSAICDGSAGGVVGITGVSGTTGGEVSWLDGDRTDGTGLQPSSNVNIKITASEIPHFMVAPDTLIIY